MKALLIGAGAVGQVYGRHLHAGGADVSFFVKPKYADAAAQGFLLHHLGFTRTETARFQVPALTDLDQVRGQAWDQVWICISATALRGPWLPPFLEAIGRSATVVLLTPGLGDPDLLTGVARERVVQGMISMISYQAPLPGEDLEPGVAYWLPPLSPSPFTGERSRARAVVQALRSGGCPAKVHPNAPLAASRGSSILMPHLVALEAAGWRFAEARRGPHLALAARASREALAVVAAETQTPVACVQKTLIAQPLTMKAVLLAAPWIVPLPLEAYLEYHFTKVGDQTELMLATYVEKGRAHGLPVANLAEQLALLIGLRANAVRQRVAA
jgi:2-dehydropantoate 2-reductase